MSKRQAMNKLEIWYKKLLEDLVKVVRLSRNAVKLYANVLGDKKGTEQVKSENYYANVCWRVGKC